MDQEKIGKYIALCRKSQHLTQEELGSRVGVGYKAVSRWECGNGLPDVSIMQELCNVLNISVSDLLNGEKIKDNKDNGVIDYLKYQKKKNKRNIIIGTLLSLLIIIFLILLVYFVNNYNSIKIYHISGDSENFTYNDAMFVQTKEKYFYVYGNIFIKNEKIKYSDINTVSLMNNDKLIFKNSYDSNNNGGYLSEYYGYNEMFNDEIVSNINDWKLVINYKDKEEIISLNNNIELINNNFFERKIEPISIESQSDDEEYQNYMNSVEDKRLKLIKLLEHKGYKSSTPFKQSTLYEKNIGNYHLSIWVATNEYSLLFAEIELYDGDYKVEYQLLGQTMEISGLGDLNFHTYYSRKENLEKCPSGDVPNDTYELFKTYYDFFDEEFKELIPPESEWGTIRCDDSE